MTSWAALVFGWQRRKESDDVKLLLSTKLFCLISSNARSSRSSKSKTTGASAEVHWFTGFVATTTLSAASHANRCRCLIKCAKESARYPGDYHPCKRHGIRHPLQLPFARQEPPIEQLARKQSVSSCRCRDLPRTALTLRNDPAILLRRPAAPRARQDHFQPRHLRHSRMISHTTMSSPSLHQRKAASPEKCLDQSRRVDRNRTRCVF